MIRNISYKIEVSPLIIPHFPLLAPRKFLDVQIFNLRFSAPSEMTQKEFADRLGVQLSALKKWIQDRVKMQKATWEKYFR